MIDEAQISELVDGFYAKARYDPLLGPIFSEAIGQDWTPHLSTMKTFWSSIILGSATYKGNPLTVHRALPLLSRRHFERWLELWRATAQEICGAEGEVYIQRADRMAENLLAAVTRG